MGATDARERAVADNQFGSGTPVNWFWGLSTTTPNDDGTNFTEPSGGAYARVSHANSATNWPAATTSSGTTTKKNATAITWPNPTASWGVITYVGAFTASTGGTPEYTFVLETSISPKSGNSPVEIAANDLVVQVD